MEGMKKREPSFSAGLSEAQEEMRTNKYRKFHLNKIKNFFTVWIVKYREKFPRQVVESLNFEIFRTQPEKILSIVF